MRKALNENPVVQVAVIGLLGIFVAVMLMTRLGGDDPAAPPPSSSSSASTSSADPGAPASEAAAPASEAIAPASEAAAPATAATSDDAATPPTATGVEPGRFVAGPGLPQKMVTAYAKGKAVALYVYRRKGVDDAYGRFNYHFVRFLRNENLESKVAMFTTNAHHIARYSRIAEGVDVSRVPALVVIKPRKLSDNQPVATVSYGYRGPESVVQAVKDALYKGRDDVPYYPE